MKFNIIVYMLFMSYSIINMKSLHAQNLHLTLDECVSLALKNNLDLQIEQQNIAESNFVLKQSKTNRLPQLNFESSYIRFSKVMEADLSESLAELPFQLPSTKLRFGDEDNYSIKLSLVQPLFTGFKIKNSILASENQLMVSKYNEQVQRNNLIFEVKQIYYTYIKAQKLVEILNVSLKSIESHINDINNLYNQQMITKNEVLKTTLKKYEIELLINKAENNIDIIRIRFLDLLGLDLSSQIDLHDNANFKLINSEKESTIDEAVAKRPELQQISFSKKAVENLINLSRADYFPLITLIGNYEYGKPGLNKLENEWMDYWTIGIAAQWNFWDWRKRKAKVEQSKTQLEKIELTKQKLLQAIQLDVQQSLLKLKEAKQSVEINLKTKIQAEENFRIVNDQFQQGIVTNSDFLDAEAQLTKSNLDEKNSIADYNIAIANLERAMGQNLHDK